MFESSLYVLFVLQSPLSNVCQNAATDTFPNTDVLNLVATGDARAVYLDFPKLFGGGLIHTKLILGDQSRECNWSQRKPKLTLLKNCTLEVRTWIGDPLLR